MESGESASDTETRVRGRRLSWLALALSVGAVIAALVGAVGSGNGTWEFRTGFTILRWAFFAAIAGGLLAIFAWVRGRRSGRGRTVNAMSLFVSLLFVAYVGNLIMTARSVPAIHDITTDLEDVPEFRALSVREDNLENIPDMDRPGLAAMKPEARWKAIHREAYADIQPIRVNWSVSETIQKAQVVAQKRGWNIAHFDPNRGVLEATATTLFFRFKDDVVIRARKAPEGGTRVDMRSISRVGGSDVGVNAKRIREFLQDLKQS